MQVDRAFTGNTNSDLYQWESENRTDDLQFEEDLIASTNEITYNSMHIEPEKMAQVKRAHLQNPFASDILMPR